MECVGVKGRRSKELQGLETKHTEHNSPSLESVKDDFIFHDLKSSQ